MAGQKKGNPRYFRSIPSSHNPIHKKIENEDQLNEEAKIFENQAQVYNNIKNTQIKRKEDGLNKQKKSDKNMNCKLSDLYRRQKHRALQEILLGPTVYCPISADKIEQCYINIFMKILPCNIHDISDSLWQKNTPSDKANSILTKEFTPKEVKSKLLSKINNFLSSSRSVGLDRLKFENLHTYDPDCSKMTFLFNACLKLQTVPKIWMEFYSVLVRVTDNSLGNDNVKNNSMDNTALLDIENWQSITMERTISKLFQTLIAARLIAWAQNTGRLSATQKGFLTHNAACESSFILQECKNYAQDKEKDLAVAWLDFKNSSDHIPQSAVLHALNMHSVPSPIIEIIRKMFKFSNTRFRVKGNDPDEIRFTNVIPILRGLPQGSPISPILLDLVIEPILRALSNAVNNSFEMYNNKINHYAIPNELTLIADSPHKLQNLLRLVEENAKLIGLEFNINKCSTYLYDGKEKEVNSDNRFLFFGKKLSILPEEKIEQFFGVKQGLSIGQDGCPSIQEMMENIKAIDNSPLQFYQKVESVLLYIIPRVENCLRGLQSTVSLGKADEASKSLGKAEELLKDRFKSWLNLPDTANTRSVVFQVAGMNQSVMEDIRKRDLPVKNNYLPFMDLFYIMKVVHALKMLTSQDEIVKKVANATLMAEVNSLLPDKKKMKIEKRHLAQYLSGELHIINKESKSMWSIVREASLQLKIKIPLKWQYNNGMQLTIDFKNIKKKSILSGKNVNSIEEKLKIALIEYYIDATMKNSSGPQNNLKAIV